MAVGESDDYAQVEFTWLDKEKKYRCQVTKHRRGWSWWNVNRQYDPQQRMKVTLYVDEDDHALFEKGGDHINSMGCRPADLWFRWWTSDKTIAAFTRCQFRPWTKLDAERFNKPCRGTSWRANARRRPCGFTSRTWASARNPCSPSPSRLS
jgi:hypothetical protein